MRSPLEGLTFAEIRCTFPKRKPVVGYAATARISAVTTRDALTVDRFMEYIETMLWALMAKYKVGA